MESAIDVDTARVRERMAALFIYKPPDVTLIQHLRDLAGAIHMQLAALSENAAAARQAVSTIRERSSLPFADSDAAEAALVAWIDAAELEKSTKLEAEAVAVDEALSEADTLYVAASSAAADHSTSRIDVARVAARLHRLQQRVTALPTAPVEPVVFNVVPGPFEPTSRSNVLGRVSAPRAVTPADVNVDGAPSFVVPGGTLRFSLKLADSYECEDDFDAAVAIDMLSAHARLSVSLLAAPTADGAGAPQQPEPIALAAALNADVEGRRLVISIPVPPNTLKDSTVALESLVIGAGSSASAASAVPDAPLLSVRVGANHDPAPPGPLTDATRRGDLAAVHELLAAGASTEEGIEEGYTPLAIVASRQYAGPISQAAAEAVGLALVEAGATLLLPRRHGGQVYTPLFAAVISGMDDLVVAMIARAPPGLLDAPGPDGHTPLLMAALGGHTRVALALIAAGALVNTPLPAHGPTPLHAAAAAKASREVVVALLAAGAAVDAPDDAGRTPLIAAAASGFGADAVVALLAAGANARAADTLGHTALHVVAEPRRTEIVKALVSHGADVDATDEMGATPLITMAKAGRTEAALLLLSLGADARKATLGSGRTALHEAAALGDPRLVKALLALRQSSPGRGVQAGLADAAGLSPADCARVSGHVRIASLIEAAADDDDEDDD